MKYEVDKRKDKTIFKLKEKTLGHKIAAELKTELIFLQKETTFLSTIIFSTRSCGNILFCSIVFIVYLINFWLGNRTQP